MSKAVKLYEDFHKYSPNKIAPFPASVKIPQEVVCIGPAVHILYRSAKCDPITYLKPNGPIDYIHEHKAGVKVYLVGDKEEGPLRKVPRYIRGVEEITFLGKCLGFAFLDEGETIGAECTSCELFAIPSGKALLIIEKKKKLLAIIWGGKLNVEPRGIVG